METKVNGFSAALLKTLKQGDTFTTEGFFQGVSSAPCIWTVESMGKGNGAYTLKVSYLGVDVGRFFVSLKKGDSYRLEEMR